MKSPSNVSAPSSDLDARLARFGQRVAASLNERSADLPHDVTERLRGMMHTHSPQHPAAGDSW